MPVDLQKLKEIRDQFADLSRYKGKGSAGAETFITKEFGPSFVGVLDELIQNAQDTARIHYALPAEGDIVSALVESSRLLTQNKAFLQQLAVSEHIPIEYSLTAQTMLLQTQAYLGEITLDEASAGMAEVAEQFQQLEELAQNPPPSSKPKGRKGKQTKRNKTKSSSKPKPASKPTPTPEPEPADPAVPSDTTEGPNTAEE